MKAIVRQIKPEDHAFIYATWLRQLWFSTDNATMLPKAMFMKLHHTKIERKLSKGGTVLCSEEDPTLIYGYSVCGRVYFKRAFRGIGLEEMLK